MATKCFNTEPETAATIEKLAVMFEVTDSFVVNSLVKFALLNRNWPAHGMIYWRSARKSDSRGRRKSDLKPGTGGDDGEE